MPIYPSGTFADSLTGAQSSPPRPPATQSDARTGPVTRRGWPPSGARIFKGAATPRCPSRPLMVRAIPPGTRMLRIFAKTAKTALRAVLAPGAPMTLRAGAKAGRARPPPGTRARGTATPTAGPGPHRHRPGPASGQGPPHGGQGTSPQAQNPASPASRPETPGQRIREPVRPKSGTLARQNGH
jgi:hypothetical protein